MTRCPYCVNGCVTMRRVSDKIQGAFACRCEAGEIFKARHSSALWEGVQIQWRKGTRGSDEWVLSPDVLNGESVAAFPRRLAVV